MSVFCSLTHSITLTISFPDLKWESWFLTHCESVRVRTLSRENRPCHALTNRSSQPRHTFYSLSWIHWTCRYILRCRRHHCRSTTNGFWPSFPDSNDGRVAFATTHVCVIKGDSPCLLTMVKSATDLNSLRLSVQRFMCNDVSHFLFTAKHTHI